VCAVDAKGKAIYEQLTKEAAAVPAGSEGLQFLPYLTGERTPHLDPNARGAFVGLTLSHSRGHMTRAIMEGVTYSLRDSYAIMSDLGVSVKQIRASGGGAKNPFWRQMQADVFGKPVFSMVADEGAAYGVALLAAVGAGEFKDITEACAATIKTADESRPNAAARKVYDLGFPVYQSLYSSLKDEFRKLG
jgi:xylulokinase